MDPFTIGGLALTGGSMLANLFKGDAEQRAYDEAMRNAQWANMLYAGNADAINDRALGRFDGFGGKMDARAQELAGYFSGAGAPNSNPSPVPAQTAAPAQSGIMAGETAKQGARVKSFNTQQGAALGKVRSFGDTLGTANRGVARDALDLGQILSRQRGMMNLLPQQIADAQTAGGGWGALADLLRGGGKIALGYGLNPPFDPAQGGAFSTSLVPTGPVRNLYNLFR